MSYVLAAPEALTEAALRIGGIGSNIDAANAAAAALITRVPAAATDEISTQVAALFSAYAQRYQKLSTQLATFQDSFVSALNAAANSYTTAEANAVQNLVDAVNSPAEKLLGSSGALTLQSTGATSGPTSSALLEPVANAAVATPVASGGLGPAIENLYLEVEPWVQYGFNLLSYAAGWVPYVGFLAPQINFYYYLFEPIVQSVLFNTIDFIDGTVTFNQGLSNISSATTASVDQFIYTEIAWVRSFFPPLPPLP